MPVASRGPTARSWRSRRRSGRGTPTTNTLTYGGDTFHLGDTINAGGGNGEFPSDVHFPAGCDVNNNSTGFLIQATSLK